ncbi:uncharacterized protein PODANS_2_8650 [Podospora anserina S mat+]|uniref:Copper homeostasis protein cutC homolog n=1 Tax=Podospora anserina (strain S / ATCC MYA-4624 / DSM 980 / FGSC 10383) TaxID=515849 RepID=B2B6S0_PODAN|nr:uncharacterized protein PODANS_2_8650 [Podospora anserina S mat+]CAP73497.1 unnamed protein product [Podospora anserina S mat+]CDP25899.1 Putative copper homeostasis protein cutC [Podospora anserina S mat+]
MEGSGLWLSQRNFKIDSPRPNSSPKHQPLSNPGLSGSHTFLTIKATSQLSKAKMSGIEVAIFGPRDGVAAVKAVGEKLNGKTRLELNRTGSYEQNGLTPSTWELEHLNASLDHAGLQDVPVRIMIRPCGAPKLGPDFVYSDAEFEQMKSDIRKFKESKHMSRERGDGFVFGVLRQSCSVPQMLVVDRVRTAELKHLAGDDFKCVFHRAFDLVISTSRDEMWVDDLEWLKTQGMAVLTSGGCGNASNNTKALKQVLIETARIGQELIVGGGVRSDTLESLGNGMGGLGYIYALTSLHSVGMVLHSSFLKRDPSNVVSFDVEEARKFKATLYTLISSQGCAN